MKSISLAGIIAVSSALVVSGLVAASVMACSDDVTEEAGPCDSAKCLAGNTCIAVKGETKCRKTCTAQTCPFNYSCVVNETGQGYCAENKVKLADTKGKQWGASCNASSGLDANPDCDTTQGFQCYGETPSDANAYCTRYACADDSDCAGGFWCATVNKQPDVTTLDRSIGETVKVCKKRDYCGPCTRDLDCAPQIDGRPSKCAKDGTGAGFCTRACDNDASCNRNDVKCDNGTCTPRAGACKGDGNLCSPCLADTDCKNGGLCLQADYSTEKYCGFKSPTACTQAGNACPKDNAAKARVGCYTSGPLKDQCTGFYRVADQLFPGCWSAERGCVAKPEIGGAKCSAVFPTARDIDQVPSGGAAPTMSGGLLLDGRYVLKSSVVYGGNQPSKIRRSIVVTGCGSQFELAEQITKLPPVIGDAGADGDVPDADVDAGAFDAGAPTSAIQAGTSATATGAKLTLTAICPAAGAKEYTYTAKDTELQIVTSGPSGVISYDVYDRQ